MSLEGREQDPRTREQRTHDLRCKVAAAVWIVGTVTLEKMARDCGALPPLYDDAGHPWADAESNP